MTPTSLAADEDAYKGKISHVVLFNYTSNAPAADQSVLDGIMGAGGATGGMSGAPGGLTPSAPPPGMTPGAGMTPPTMPGGTAGAGAAGPGSRDAWRPLSPSMGGGGGGGGMGGAGPFNNDMMRNPSFAGTPSARPSGPSSNAHQRTEFVVLFFWKELTPSDALRGDDGTAPKPAATATGTPGMTPTAPPPAAAAEPLTPKSAIE